ncbi:hypothetical protein JZ751_000064 [Albula glossodonta]|uniref:HMG box domain-containing protein n=1 Tax=Albula glossodonta TaxID=121402 RepID=A0A8T2PVH5_9TELE|nr:hypothetical protein JZ751_000064 [Albula glossodonta]
MLHKANSDSSRCSGHPQMDDFRPSIQSVMMQQNHLTTINQSQLSTHLGLSRNSIPHSSPSPPGSKRASPSPSSSVPEEDPDEAQKVGGAEKRQAVDAGKKPKPQKKKKKKDPNEPQKPVSAYALFFRDTQAAIKGQNPSATFGEVSKIVASTWDGLGEEQKQLYKRKTEIAKKEYLKQLAAYRASLVSQSYSEPGEITGAQMTGSKPVGFPGVGVGQGQGGAYPGHAHQHQQAQHQASVSPLLHPSLTRGLSMPVPLSGANMAAASPPPPHPAMHQHASLQHQHQPVAMQKPLGNQHQHQLPLHSQPMPQVSSAPVM